VRYFSTSVPEGRIKMATKGMDRMFISVSNLQDSLAFYRDWIGMKVVADETLEANEIQQLWNLSGETKTHAVSLKNEQQSTLLELIEFIPHSGRTIREGAKPWDYGIYAITFLVKDIDKIYRDLTEKGFTFVSPPIRYQPNWVPHQVKEATLLGPDNVPIDHFERMKDEDYGSHGDYVKFDHCAQIVEDLSEVKRFYGDILGLELKGAMTIPEGLIDDVLTIPPGTEVKTSFFNKENALMIEFLQLSMKGKSLASIARPPNLGLFMISFEVDDFLSLMETCKKEGISILSGPVELHAKLYGKMRAVTIEGPSGVMIELFER
jgi:catechol 2,3-dioxygenase-like lactoylglutathione lyase family enzyme